MEPPSGLLNPELLAVSSSCLRAAINLAGGSVFSCCPSVHPSWEWGSSQWKLFKVGATIYLKSRKNRFGIFSTVHSNMSLSHMSPLMNPERLGLNWNLENWVCRGMLSAVGCSATFCAWGFISAVGLETSIRKPQTLKSKAQSRLLIDFFQRFATLNPVE